MLIHSASTLRLTDNVDYNAPARSRTEMATRATATQMPRVCLIPPRGHKGPALRGH
jgi:hypothetical protein